MIILWSPQAIDDLAALRAYIAADNPAAAQRIVLHIIRKVLRVYHGARKWPERF